jgi:hypothetical protein
VPAEFQLKALDSCVQLLYLPAHTSHRLQPLDLTVFGPLKTYYSIAIESFGEYSITGPSSKRRFIRAYLEASCKAFSKENIVSGFRGTGIWPLQGERIVTEIRQLTRPRTPPLEVNSEPNILIQTPYNRGKMVQMVQDIQGTPSHVSHTRRRKGRKVIKYTDSILVAFAHEKA